MRKTSLFYYALLSILVCCFMNCSKDDEIKFDKIVIENAINDTIVVNTNTTLQVAVKPMNLKKIRFFSTASDIFTVSPKEGVISPIDGGIGTLNVTALNHNEKWITTSCIVRVNAIITEIKPINIELIIAADQSINAKELFNVFPSKAKKDLKFKSSDESIFTIDEAGNIILKSKGVAKITATNLDGTVVSEPIEIYANYELKKIDLSSTTVTASSSAGFRFGPKKIVDGSRNSFWHCPWGGAGTPAPHWLLIDLKKIVEFSQLLVVRKSGSDDTRTVELYYSDTDEDDLKNDDSSFVKLGAEDYSSDANESVMSFVFFPESYKGRYIKIILPNNPRAGNNSLAEVELYSIE